MKFEGELFKANKSSLAYKLAGLIHQAAVEVVGKRAVKLEDVILEYPLRQGFGGELSRTAQGKLDHGDYATNIALKVKSEEFPIPLDLANQIVNVWRSQGLPDFIAKIEVANPGFINLWLHPDWLISQLQRVLEEKDGFGKLNILKGKKILLEHTSPNPQTTIMLGHLRNNFLGMSMANILEFLGAKVTKDCIVNDRGIHLCRSIWGYLTFAYKYSGLNKSALLAFRKVRNQQIKSLSAKVNWRDLLEKWTKKKSNWWQPKDLGLKSDHANLIWYVLGSRAYNLSKKVKKQVEEILVAWEAEDQKARPAKSKGRSGVWQIWRRILDWSDKGYQQTYERVDSVHDWVWREHKLYKAGKELVEKGLEKGVFRRSEGAIVSDLAKYDLPDTILIKSDRAAVYHTFDLNLVSQKRKKFPSDLYIWDIGVEQTLYLKQLFAMCEQLGIGKREDYFHLAYALINFKGGKKMSTRRGEVVMADEILDELHQRAVDIIKASNQKLRGKLNPKQLDELGEAVALSAIKYSLLKFSRETTIQFDTDESLALEGNSGPYLQYTYARCQSVLHKASQGETSNSKHLRGGKVERSGTFDSSEVSAEGTHLLRTLYRFPEIIQEAGENFAPNLLCNFLFDLAQKYNLFYNKQPILKAETGELRDFRLALTTAVGQILKTGLSLLGIETPGRM